MTSTINLYSLVYSSTEMQLHNNYIFVQLFNCLMLTEWNLLKAWRRQQLLFFYLYFCISDTLIVFYSIFILHNINHSTYSLIYTSTRYMYQPHNRSTTVSTKYYELI